MIPSKEVEPVSSIFSVPIYWEGHESLATIPKESMRFYEKAIRKMIIGSLRRGVPVELVYMDNFGMIHFQTVPVKVEDTKVG